MSEQPEAQPQPAQPAAGTTPQPEAKTFERQMEDLGKKIAATGQKVGEGAGKKGSEFERRWYGTLGILAPIIGGLIATVVFLIFFLVVGAVAPNSEHRAFWEQLRDFLENYFLLFVGLFFLSSFENYFTKVHRRTLIWATPVMAAFGLLAWAWILAQVLFIGARTLDRPGLKELGDIVQMLLPVIFVIVLLVVLIVVILITTREKMAAAKTGV